MSSRCERCGKGVQYGHNVSHAKNRTNRVFKPNLHTLRVVVNGVRKKMTLCSSCVRMVRREVQEVQKVLQLPQVRKVPFDSSSTSLTASAQGKQKVAKGEENKMIEKNKTGEINEKIKSGKARHG